MNKKKKILIFTRHTIPGGVQRFLINILREFNIDNKNFEYFVTHSTCNIKEENNDNINYIEVKAKSKLFFDYIQTFKYILKIKPDIIIYPANIIPFTHFFLKKLKFNITYDLGYFVPELNAYKSGDTLYMKTFIPYSCRKSTRTFAISEATKKDIVSRIGINPEKIIVCPLAVEKAFMIIEDEISLNETIRKFNINQPYLFYAGSLSPRKNLKNIISAFDRLINKIPHTLVLTGNIAWKSTEIYEIMKTIPNDRLKLVGNVSETDLVNLYNKADLFLYPSLYEGFGLPILEAQACGCPVLTSNVTSCPEVAGNSALVVNPYDIDEIANGILKIVKDTDYKQNLIKLGFDNIKRYNWQKTARVILDNLTEKEKN